MNIKNAFKSFDWRGYDNNKTIIGHFGFSHGLATRRFFVICGISLSISGISNRTSSVVWSHKNIFRGGNYDLGFLNKSQFLNSSAIMNYSTFSFPSSSFFSPYITNIAYTQNLGSYMALRNNTNRYFSQTVKCFTKNDKQEKVDLLLEKVTRQANEIVEKKNQISDCATDIYEKQTRGLIDLPANVANEVDSKSDEWFEKTHKNYKVREEYTSDPFRSSEKTLTETFLDEEQIKTDVQFTKYVENVLEYFFVPIEENRDSYLGLLTTRDQLKESADNLIRQQVTDLSEIIKLENEIKDSNVDDSGEGSSNQQSKLKDDKNQTSDKKIIKDGEKSDSGGSGTGNEGLAGENSTNPSNFRSYLESFFIIIIDVISSFIDGLSNFFM